MSATFVTDFDGTLTNHDFYQLALDRWTPPAAMQIWNEYLAKQRTLFETLSGMLALIQAPESEVVAALADLDFDPQAARAMRKLQQAGWTIEVASAGCAWYIEKVFEREGIRATIHACPGDFLEESGGLSMKLPHGSPYLSHVRGIDKAAIVRAAIERGGPVAFAGDSYPDLEAARLVQPEYLFARSALAEQLRLEGRAFHAYDRWHETADRLLRKTI